MKSIYGTEELYSYGQNEATLLCTIHIAVGIADFSDIRSTLLFSNILPGVIRTNIAMEASNQWRFFLLLISSLVVEYHKKCINYRASNIL